MKQIIVTAGVIHKEQQILVAQRPEGGKEGGKWEFPGGKVELGEDPRHCLRRELAEELGITVQVGPVLEVLSEVSDELQLILIYFLCQLEQGEPRALQCQEVRWLQAGQIDALTKPPADQRFWENYRPKILVNRV